MKSSQTISLVLITAALASCHNHADDEWTAGERHVYMRSDTSASYSPTYHTHIWFRAFRPYGDYYHGFYYPTGYYSDAISLRSNFGSNSAKASIARGGFGGHAGVSS